MANIEPMCMDPPKPRFVISKRTIISIFFVWMILLMFLIPPPIVDKSPTGFFISTIEDQLEIDSLIETQDGGFAFVVAERPIYQDHWPLILRGRASFIKTDRNGVILWNVTLPVGNQTDVFLPSIRDVYNDYWVPPSIHIIHETATGDFLITSFSSSKPVLIKISYSGDILGIQDSLVDVEYDPDRYARIDRIIETSDGKFLIGISIMEPPFFWMWWSFRNCIVKIDNEGTKEWLLWDSENLFLTSTHELFFGNLFLSSTHELFVQSTISLHKYSPEGVPEWNISLAPPLVIPMCTSTNSGFLWINNTRIIKIDFNGELDWVIDYDWNWDSPDDGFDPQYRLFINEDEYFIVGRDKQGQTDAINGSLYKYRIAKVNTEGSILWQIEEFVWEKRSDPYYPFPVYSTSSGLLIVTNELIIVKNDGSVNTRSFNPGIIRENLRTLNYETGFENHTYYTIYQISQIP